MLKLKLIFKGYSNMKKCFDCFRLIFFIFIFPFQILNSQNQIGLDIEGKSIVEFFGNSVTLSADGSTFASCSDINTGNVRVYKHQNDTWAQLGNDIVGFNDKDNDKKSLSINANGTILAIGSPNINNKGRVSIYKIIKDIWVKLGEDINGVTNADNFGKSVTLNSSGLTLAIGSINSPNGSLKGVVKVFSFLDNKWVQQGQDIVGKTDNDWSGWSVSISSNGLIVAIGAIGNDDNGNNSGQTKVFKLINEKWEQIGQDINGKSPEDQFGCSISLSADGLTIAIASTGNDDNGEDAGLVRIYKYSANSWVQLGQDIKGKESKDWFGWSISLSSDGSKIAIGAPCFMKEYLAPGYVRVFNFKNNLWEQIGIDIKGEFEDDLFGVSVSLSADGTILAIGGPFNDGNGSDSGHVRVFKINESNKK